MDGFLILDKPEGMTSAQCVYKLRSILGTKRIGHCGTLDPLATGLLPICVGEATKFSDYTTNLDKVYEVLSWYISHSFCYLNKSEVKVQDPSLNNLMDNSSFWQTSKLLPF